MNNFQYLTSGGSFSVDGVNDSKDFGETIAGELHLKPSVLFYNYKFSHFVNFYLHSNESNGFS